MTRVLFALFLSSLLALSSGCDFLGDDEETTDTGADSADPPGGGDEPGDEPGGDAPADDDPGKDGPGKDDPADEPPPEPGDGEFLSSCDPDAPACVAGLECFKAGKKGGLCSHACTTDEECEAPSKGCDKKKGYCKAP